ncbi:MAG TPA: hypothetical protein DCX89_03880 [Saprospirales bacterium]|nr:hypothetical protein [Saprospirales bacterium]HRQ29534.1 hypothetical protein [Saprospiraceae bacterium]
MKKSFIIVLVALLILGSTAVWLFSTGANIKPMDLLHFGVIFLVVVFALFLGYKRWTSEKRGEPTEDELSKKVLQKTAAISYYISLYFWVFLLWLKDRIEFDSDELLGTGILGMALTFGISWLIIHYKGLANE